MRRYYEEKQGFKIDAEMKLDLEKDPFEEIPPPPVATVFLDQHVGSPGKPLVKEGDRVLTGQKITEGEEALTLPVHSPITGRVTGFVELRHPISGSMKQAVIIEAEGEEGWLLMEKYPDFKSLTVQEIIGRVREAGIVGLGGAAFPAHIKLSRGADVDHLIINAKESDPNLACDVRLVLERPEELINGIEIMAHALEVEQVIFATRTEEGELHQFEKFLKERGIKIAHIRPSYSVGSERLLVRELLGREVPADQFPPDVGVVVHNVATCLATTEAVVEGKPLISRGITFYSRKTGGKNLWVRMGTPVEHILNYMGISSESIDRVVLGSIMMGKGAPDLRTPLVKCFAGVVALTSDEHTPYENPYPCIRCGYCDAICPVDIYPSLLLEALEKGKTETLDILNIDSCIDCNLCSYVCPSSIRVNPKQRAR
jgi:electron transport complex protein RnfC